MYLSFPPSLPRMAHGPSLQPRVTPRHLLPNLARQTRDLEMLGTMQDRRDAKRLPLILAVEVVEVKSGARLSARTSDVSRTGCYIDTLNPTPTGTIVRVKLSHEGEELDLLARIVYVSPRLGMGLRFDESITPEQLSVLDRWLAQ